MDETRNTSADAPAQSKFPPILRAIGIGVLVLILWSVNKLAVSRLPAGSAWRYVIGAVIISVGLGTVLSLINRLNNKNS